MHHTISTTAHPAFGPMAGRRNFDGVPLQNRLLASLDPAGLEALKPHIETHRLDQDEVLFEADQPPSHVYFPDSAGVSLACVLDGRMTVAGTVGREGMVGVGIFLGQETSLLRASTHLAGMSRRMSTTAFKQLATADGPLHHLMLGYTNAFLGQIIETQRCNALHRVEQRCARWLLVTSQRADATEFPLAPELLALVIGTHAAGVLAGLRALEQRGLIEYDRSHVRVLDVRALEDAACACTRMIRGS